MDNTVIKILIEPAKEFFQKIIDFLPNLLSSFIIVITGLFFAYIVKYLFIRILKIVHFDNFCERVGVNQVLLKGGIKDTPSYVLSRLAYWLIVFIFIIISLNSLRITSVEQLMTEFLLYLPNVLVAIIIVIFGYLIGNFLSRATLIASVNAGITIAGLLSHVVKLGVFLLAVTMSLEQLGIGQATVTIAFGIIFGGAVLAIAIACGLGGKDIAKEYLEKRMLRKKDQPDDIQHL